MTTPSSGPILQFGNVRMLNVPHAENVAREIFDEDCYRFDEIPDGAMVFDVGAFYGEFALRCAVEKRCRVLAYEPCRHNFEVMQLNITINTQASIGFPARGSVNAIPRAVGAPGVRAFMSRAEHPAGSLLADEAKKHGLAGETRNVHCVALDKEIEFFADRSDVVVVKLDCEGAEHEIFHTRTWLERVTILTMEWHNHDGGHFRDILVAHGFDVELEGGGPKPRPAWDPSIGGGLLFARRRSARR
jgi:FkbM family methyltransferase